jgi:hypothetical protein
LRNAPSISSAISAIARNVLPQDSARDRNNRAVASCSFGDIWPVPGKNGQNGGPGRNCGTVVLEFDLRLRFFAIGTLWTCYLCLLLPPFLPRLRSSILAAIVAKLLAPLVGHFSHRLKSLAPKLAPQPDQFRAHFELLRRHSQRNGPK